MSKVSSAIQHFTQHRQIVDSVQENLGAVNDPNATVTNASISVGPHGNRVVYSKPTDIFSYQTRIDNISKATKSETMANVLANYTSLLEGTDQTDSSLLNAIDNFTADVTGLALLREGVSRQAFLDKAQSLTTSFNDKIDGIKTLRGQSHNQYLQLFQRAGEVCKQLFQVNEEIAVANTSRGGGFRLHAKRDELVSELAQSFNIKISYGKNGLALITTKEGSLDLVSKSKYARFVTEGTFHQSFGTDFKPSDLTVDVESVRGDGSVASKSRVFGGTANTRRVWGGKLEAYVNLRDDKLSNALDAVQTVAADITRTINDIHNDGSPWPPKTKYESTNLFSPSSTLGFEGVLSVFALNSDGKQLEGGAGRLHQMQLDFSKLRTQNGVGNPSLRDVANELNYMLSSAPSEKRAALGEMNIPTGAAGAVNTQYSTSEYLLNNIKLVGAADISNNQYTFDLELDGNSYFDTKVEILRVDSGPNGGPLVQLPANQLPQAFTLNRDTITRTGQTITVPTTGANNDEVKLTVRVTGENGVVRESDVTFIVDSTNTAQLNKRIAFGGDPLNMNGGAGPGAGFTSPTSHTGLATVKLVDANGQIIADDDIATPAKLLIESNTQEYRIALQSSTGSQTNFSQILGLNNLFNQNDDGTFQVKQEILENPTLLSGGQVSRGEIRTVAKVGDAKAKAVFDFQGPIANLAAADTITIDGTVLTLTAALPANENEVQVNAAGFAATKADIVTAINNHSVLSQKFSAQDNAGGNDFTVEALEPGEWANNAPPFAPGIAASMALGGGTLGQINAGGFVAGPVGDFIGGTDKDEAKTIFDYNIGNRSVEIFKRMADLDVRVHSFEGAGVVFGFTGTISGYASEFVSLLSNQANDAESESEIRVKILDESDKDWKQRFGIKPNEEYIKAVEVGAILRLLANAMSEAIKSQKDVHAIIAGA